MRCAQVYDQSKAALREVLLRVDAGAYRDEGLIGYVELGAYSLCVHATCTFFYCSLMTITPTTIGTHIASL